MSKYAIGVDYGTLSMRAILADVANGDELGSVAMEYPHQVMDRALPCGTLLGQDWALQHPRDYLDVLYAAVPELVRKSGLDPTDIIGIGVDFTASTILPVTEAGTPLCFLPQYEREPHAYAKLWKHHAAQDHASRMTEIARTRREAWLDNYGGKISSEWAIPKLWQMAEEAPEVYDAMACWIEAADWIVWRLCGVHTRNSCAAGYKAFYNKRKGYPTKAFFEALSQRLAGVIEEKANAPVTPPGTKAGGLTGAMAEALGLNPGTAVSVGHVDAHVCMPAVGIDGPGKLLAIMGTSTCHILLGEKEAQVPGMCGAVEDGVMPGYLGYEAGQSCVGDHFAWLAENCCPEVYRREAQARGLSLQQLFTEKAERLEPGQSGLLALDWWNGNRSVLVDVDLSGMMLGMTLQTTAEAMYRALIEATAYGTRIIVENFRHSGLPVEVIYASGGISQKNAMAMQIYADVLNMPIRIAGSAQGPALGSAIFGAVAAGTFAGGYDDVFEAARRMGKVDNRVYVPIADNVRVYDALYAEYRTLHDYFGRGENDVMKRLKHIKMHHKG